MTRALTLLMLLIAHTAMAQVREKLSPTRLNGEWTGTLVLDNSAPRIAVVFQLTDSTFAGKVYTDGQLMGDMQAGSVSGDTVHFNIDRLDFTGVVTGERMKVALIVYNGSTRTFTLTKTPELPKPPAGEIQNDMRGNDRRRARIPMHRSLQ
jgi:hypothetical protein